MVRNGLASLSKIYNLLAEAFTKKDEGSFRQLAAQYGGEFVADRNYGLVL